MNPKKASFHNPQKANEAMQLYLPPEDVAPNLHRQRKGFAQVVFIMQWESLLPLSPRSWNHSPVCFYVSMHVLT